MFKMQELGKKFEKFAENTMYAPVFISARNSEARLREAYNLPVPANRATHEAWSKQQIANLITEINARAQIMCEQGYLARNRCSEDEFVNDAIAAEEIIEVEEEHVRASSEEMDEDEAEQEEEEQETNDLNNAASSYGSNVSPNSLLRFVFGSQSTTNNVNTRQNAVPYVSSVQNSASRTNLIQTTSRSSSSNSNNNANRSQNENMHAIIAPTNFLRPTRARSSLSSSSNNSSLTLSPLLDSSLNSSSSNSRMPPPPPPGFLSLNASSNANNNAQLPRRSASANNNSRGNQIQVPLRSSSSNSNLIPYATPYAVAIQSTSRNSNITAPSSQSAMSQSSSNNNYPSELTVRRRSVNMRSTGSHSSSNAARNVSNSNVSESSQPDFPDEMLTMSEFLRNHPISFNLPLSSFSNNSYGATASSASIVFFNITEKSQDLIASYNDTTQDLKLSKENPEIYVDLIQARRALDIWAALQELHSRKCHMQRYNMEKTGIIGYGLHEVIALLWHSIKEAQKTDNLNAGVDIDEALYALVHGIANAARGKNRDTPGATDNYDDLSPVSDSKCDQGCYNSLLHSMLGILTQVEIVYSYMERFSIFLQKEVCKQLISYTNDIELARMYLNIWLGHSKDRSSGYEHFVQSVKEEFPEMVKRFIEDNSNTTVEAKRLKQYLKEEIKKVDNIGIPCIETVAPTVAMLEALWNRNQRKSIKRQLSPS